MEYLDNTSLRPVAYNPNENISRSSHTSRSSNASASNASKVTTYSVHIKYAPTPYFTREYRSYSRPITGVSISRPVSELYSRPISELYKAEGVVRTPTKDMLVSQVLPSRPRDISSKLPSLIASGNLSLFQTTPQVVNVTKTPRIKASNLTTPSTMSPLFPLPPPITTGYTTPNRSPLVVNTTHVTPQTSNLKDINALSSKALERRSNKNSLNNSVHSVDTNE